MSRARANFCLIGTSQSSPSLSPNATAVCKLGADAKVKDKILANMSQRAAEILVEDMEARGPVRLAEVEAAQKEILAIVRKLADEGTVQLSASKEAFV